jgi:hypothetical protein
MLKVPFCHAVLCVAAAAGPTAVRVATMLMVAVMTARTPTRLRAGNRLLGFTVSPLTCGRLREEEEKIDHRGLLPGTSVGRGWTRRDDHAR